MRALILKEIAKTSDLLEQLQKDDSLLNTVEEIAIQCVHALKKGHKILFAGNGGSAADAQHLAAELVGRLHHERSGLAALALTTDSSILTAVSNDYGFEYLFARQIEALGQAGDIFIGITTSGKSKNILAGMEMARAKKLITVGLTGARGEALGNYCDYVIKVPTADTQKIQEAHIILGHIICAGIEEAVCAKETLTGSAGALG